MIILPNREGIVDIVTGEPGSKSDIIKALSGKKNGKLYVCDFYCLWMYLGIDGSSWSNCASKIRWSRNPVWQMGAYSCSAYCDPDNRYPNYWRTLPLMVHRINYKKL
jgi:hypothetical protein